MMSQLPDNHSKDARFSWRVDHNCKLCIEYFSSLHALHVSSYHCGSNENILVISDKRNAALIHSAGKVIHRMDHKTV